MIEKLKNLFSTIVENYPYKNNCGLCEKEKPKRSKFFWIKGSRCLLCERCILQSLALIKAHYEMEEAQKKVLKNNNGHL